MVHSQMIIIGMVKIFAAFMENVVSSRCSEYPVNGP